MLFLPPPPFPFFCWSFKQEAVSPTYRGKPFLDVHHRRNYYIIPQNKLGQDIFIRATEVRGLPNIIKMPSGDMKRLKVPVWKNMLESHMRGNRCKKLRTMVTVIIAGAEVCFLVFCFFIQFWI